MKSKRFWFRAIMIVILSGVALGGLIAASPTLISDWIFRTGQHTFTVYNSSTQAIESVDNRNKGRKQYGALSVDGALYANGAINATGAINIGADVSLTRSAPNILSTPDSIVSATHTIVSGDINIGGGGTAQRLTFQDNTAYEIRNAANYYKTAGYAGMLKIVTQLPVTEAAMIPKFEIQVIGYAGTYGKADLSAYYYITGGYFHTGYSWTQTEGYFPYREITYGTENGKLVIVLSKSFGTISGVRLNLVSTIGTNSNAVHFAKKYSIEEISDLTGIDNQRVLSAATAMGKIFSNGVIVGTNKTSLASGYVLDVSGAVYVSGTIYGGGLISGGTLQDRTAGAKEDSLSDVNKWKIVGEEIDHDSLGDCAVDIKEIKTGFEISNKAGETYNTINKVGKLDKDNGFTLDFFKAIEDFKAGKEISAEYTVKEVTAVVNEKGRNISKTISTLSRAVQQLSERLDRLEGR